MPRGCCEPNYAGEVGNLSQEASLQKSPSLEDDVEVPDSPDEGDFACSRRPGLACVSDDEIVSADEADNIFPKVSTTGSTKRPCNDDHHCVRIPQDGQVAMWSTVTKETEALIHLDGNASFSSSYSSSSKTKRPSKFVKGQLKQKFSLHSSTHIERPSKISEILENLETADQAVEEDPIAECLDDFNGKPENREDITYTDSRAVQHGCSEHSITELLDTLQDKSRLIKGSFKPYCRRKGRRLQLAHKRSALTSEDRDTEDELPGPMDSGSSSDDEPDFQSSVPNFPDQKKQYVGDRFDEALKASSFSNKGFIFASPKLSGCGLYGKLQQVIKREKEKEAETLKKLQSSVGQMDESSHFDVRVLSRHLEARLVVCKCSIIKDAEDFPLLENSQAVVAKGGEGTIIFSPKVCGNIDVEVGSFIRVYAPWKEVQLKDTREVIFLCSYFSDI